MSTARAPWDQNHDISRSYFCFDAESMEQTLRADQQHSSSMCFSTRTSGSCCSQSPVPQYPPPPSPLLHAPYGRRPEGDQVVPSFQKLSVYEPPPPQSPQRGVRPLPPLPDVDDLSSDEAADSEVEFFAGPGDRERLVPGRRAEPLAFRYGQPGRRGFRGCGQINYAYASDSSAGPSGPRGSERPQREPGSLRDGARQQDRPQRRLRRSHSGPAGSFKPTNLRLPGHQHHNHGHQPQEKPEVPPRMPIPPRPAKSASCRSWSTGKRPDEEDEPPKIPPREPIPCGAPPRPASPRSLPIYVNGVMPPTQSFAPNPKYVSKAQQRQSCEGLPSPRSPCIVPVLENGRKTSTTHYYLLPHRPGYLDKFERFFKGPEPDSVSGGCYSV